MDSDGIVRFWSATSERMLGWTADDVVGNTGPLPFVPDEEREVRDERYRRVLDGGSLEADSHRLCKDGSLLDVNVHASPLRDADGRVTGVIVATTDITDRKRAEDALRNSELRFRTLVQSSADMALVLGADRRVTYASPSTLDFLGQTAEQVVGHELGDGPMHADDVERVRKTTAKLLSQPGASITIEYRSRRADGSWRWLETVVSNHLDNPAVEGLVTNSFDVTERAEALATLRNINARLERTNETLSAIVNDSPLALAVVSRRGIVEVWNPAASDLFGWTAEEMEGGPDRSVAVDFDDEDRISAAILDGRSVTNAETRRRHKDGHLIDVMVSAAPIHDDDGEVTSVVVLAADITERKQAEEALRTSDERFRSLVRNASDVISIVDADGTITYTTASTEDMLGYSADDLLGRRIFDFIDPEEIDTARELFARRIDDGGQGSGTEYRIRRADGTWCAVESIAVNLLDDPAIGGIVLTTRDISERKRAEEELRRSEERFKALVQNTSDAIVVMAANGDLTYVSPTAREVVGDTTDGYETVEQIHPDDVERVVAEFTDLMAGGDFRALEYRVRTKDGGWRVVETMADNLLDDPAVGGLVITTRDITDREEAEDALRESEARYRAIVEDQTELICRWTEEGTITFVNLAYARALGFMPDDLVGSSVFDLPPGESQFALRRRMQQTTPGRTTVEEAPLDIGGGRSRWVHWTLRAISDHTADEDRHEYQVVGLDVTDRRQAERFAEEQSNILEMVARGTDQSQVFDELCRMLESHVPDTKAAIVLYDAKVGTVTGMSAPGLPSDYVAWIEHEVGGDTTPGMEKLLARSDNVDVERLASTVAPDLVSHAAAAGIEGVWITPVSASLRDEFLGVVVCNQTEKRTPSDADRRVAQTVASLVGIAVERARAEAELSHQALHDPLTGLPNRALFLDRLQQSLARSRRSHTSCAVLFLDLDRFKTINDSLGHDTGDDLLVAVARRLEAALRPGDTVARFGGDEFTVLCDDLVDVHVEPREIADRLLDAIVRPFPLKGEEEAYLTASIGIALASGVEDRPQSLLRDADAAMYRAKEEGKARHVVFDDAMRATAVERLETETALHRALERGEFEVFYQPIVSLNDARCVGAEALVRWRHPERGLVAPVEFINLAEETGLIVSLGAWVLEEACHQAAIWQSLAATEDPFTVAVNLSARQLSNPGLVDQVRSALEQSGVDPDHIALEITEDVLMDDTEATMRTLSDLKGLGVNLGIDDFGTGYSSLGYLKRLPVGLVKIDRSFVAGLGRDTEDSAIVTAVISLADALDMKVIAEGVESSEQLAELLALGCDYAQGFFFAPPQPAGDLEVLIGPKRSWRPPGRPSWSPSTTSPRLVVAGPHRAPDIPSGSAVGHRRLFTLP
ncbi:MAG: PAS domain S-box protein [Acidimicrobiia bacterium]|nr:PAS domain S-box protein [Acidimicrobiia bacterium]